VRKERWVTYLLHLLRSQHKCKFVIDDNLGMLFSRTSKMSVTWNCSPRTALVCQDMVLFWTVKRFVLTIEFAEMMQSAIRQLAELTKDTSAS